MGAVAPGSGRATTEQGAACRDKASAKLAGVAEEPEGKIKAQHSIGTLPEPKAAEPLLTSVPSKDVCGTPAPAPAEPSKVCRPSPQGTPRQAAAWKLRQACSR